jgi:hypothetical protein
MYFLKIGSPKVGSLNGGLCWVTYKSVADVFARDASAILA